MAKKLRPCAFTIDMLTCHCLAVLAFPTGQFSTDGLPVGMQLSGPPGADGLLLSLASAVAQVLPTLDPPASPPACTGCVANVAFNAVSGSYSVLIFMEADAA